MSIDATATAGALTVQAAPPPPALPPFTELLTWLPSGPALSIAALVAGALAAAALVAALAVHLRSQHQTARIHARYGAGVYAPPPTSAPGLASAALVLFLAATALAVLATLSTGAP